MENLWKHFVLREVKAHGLGEKKKKKKIRPVEKNSRTSKKTPPVTAPKESEKSRVSSKLNWKSVLNIVSPSICLCKPDIKRLTVWSRNRVQLRESRNRPKVTRLLNASVHPFSTFLSCPFFVVILTSDRKSSWCCVWCLSRLRLRESRSRPKVSWLREACVQCCTYLYFACKS